MSTEQEVLYRSGNGEITVTNTMLSWPGTHVPIRNIASVSLKTGFPVQHLNKLKIASFVVMGLGGFGLIAGDPTFMMLGILMFIWYWFCPAAVAIIAVSLKYGILQQREHFPFPFRWSGFDTP